MPPRFSYGLSAPTLFAGDLDFQRRTSPCEAACPAGVPIQMLNTLVKQSELAQALKFLRSRNPFSAVTGRVCSHACEAACNRNHFDEGLSIRALERYASDHADFADHTLLRPRESTGRKIAIIGSGPAGMTCAYFSALLGHAVTVFEASSFLGGMPRAGIPDFRLPKDVLDREMGQILALGITAKTNIRVGRDVTLDSIVAEYDACLVAAGAWKERIPDLPGVEMAISGLAFLKQANTGQRNGIGRKVVIIGGGGVAFDCAFTARRLGATEVHVVCLEKAGEMCATPDDIRQGEEEGIRVHNGAVVSRILGRKSNTAGVEIAEVSEFGFDVNGRLAVKISDRGVCLEADAVVLAAGAEPDIAELDPHGRIRLTGRKTIEVDPATLATSVDRVFAAGDVVTGPGTVAQAVGGGRLAAIAMDNRLLGLTPGQRVHIGVGGDGRPSMRTCAATTEQHVVKFGEMMNLDFYKTNDRRPTIRLPVSSSAMSFEESDKGFGETEALAEAERCFHCGQCQLCGNCVEDCPGYVLEMTVDGPKVAHPEECWHCGNCRISCPSAAVAYEFPISMMV
ncbi:MAG: hypothetical protein A2V78_03395 [Betaproteobacteria bacterium RBG_16_64_18]|nr:MAG: hypothetical protein A2V78_03395 [Betaproteobacteria bacterium RBG_16_64_18]